FSLRSIMFKKPFSVKNNASMRNSDIKKLIARLPPSISSQLSKNSVASGRLTTFHDYLIDFYTFEKVPLFFEFTEDKSRTLFPTVYATWMSQEAWPILLVHRNVYSYLENGADLMLPGVICNENFGLPEFAAGSPIVICTIQGETITGPVAVGKAMMSSAEMRACGMKGRGVQLLHIDKDLMWELGDRKQAPSFSVADVLQNMSSEEAKLEEGVERLEIDEKKEEDNKEEITVEEGDEGDAKEDEDTAEELLLRCFLAGLKHRMTKSAPMPFDVGQFYARCLLPCVPAHRRLDMKKTKYKKFATFLDEANKMGGGAIVKIQGKGKGNYVIAAVTWDHPLLKSFELTDERITDEDTAARKIGPTIHEVLSITEPLMPLVKTWRKAEKGQTMTPQELREGITGYVKAQNLSEGKMVKTDPLLAQLARSNETTMDWNTLNQKIQTLATPTFIVELPDKRKLVYKLKAPKINLKTENRIGNKKVTIVNNCDMLGVDAKELAHRLQVGVAASASVVEASAPFTGNCIQLQGSQVAFVSTMLTTEYGIDKKYIDGFELPAKKKKK
ncbi:hypothetical protein PFISCL1PPCAC_5401, partial [Pristionchus fissidentatus]